MRLLNFLRRRPGLADLLALFAAVVYLVVALYYAHHTISILDEGVYLIKGQLFASGTYRPFEPYGPWTNKMPLSFLIPGWVQLLFGPGLRTGRYFAIFLGLFTLAGIWLTVRHEAGRWPAGLTAAAFVLNPYAINLYSQFFSQVLVACLLAWMVYFLIGRERKLWQVLAASLLAGLIVMTRQNMAPMAALVVLYVLWEGGWRRGLLSAGAVGLVLLVGHLLYWPDILLMWFPWVPADYTPFLNQFRPVYDAGESVLPPDGPSLLTRANAFWDALRNFFLPVIAVLGSWLLFPWGRDRWKTRAVVFLSVSLLVLLIIHAMASLGKSYCTYCFSTYTGFFLPLMFVLAGICVPEWLKNSGRWQGWAAALLVITAATGIGFVAYKELVFLLTIQVPRMKEMRFLPGTTDLWRLLTNRFDWPYEVLKIAIPTVGGLVFGLLLVALVWVGLWAWRRAGRRVPAFAFASLAVLTLLAALFSPTPLLGRHDPQPDCGDVIRNAEQIGAQLRQVIPNGAQVSWRGGSSPLLLQYVLPGVRIYPQELNNDFNRFKSGNTDQLLRYGYWSDDLAAKWLHEADVVLVEQEQYIPGSLIYENLPAHEVDEIARTEPLYSCRPESRLLVFQRKP